MSGSVDTALLKTFLEVHKARHFGRAAENLYLTQSAVSFRIRQLEELLGVKLFERHRHNIKLTLAGERLIPHAEAMLTTWQRAVQEVGLGGGQRLQLALGATPNLWDAYLQSSLVEIARLNPELALRAETLNVAGLTRGLLEHTLDLAVLLDPPKVEELTVAPIGRLELRLVANRRAVSIAQIEELGYVMLDWGTAFSIQQAKLFSRALTPVLNTCQGRIALDFILQVGGAAFLPSSLTAAYLEQELLFPVEDAPLLSREMFAVHRAQDDKQRAIKAIMAVLCGQQPSAPPTLQPS